MFNKFLKFIAVILVGLILSSSFVQASALMGKKYYIQLLKKPCGFNGDVMGSKYTKKAWREFYKSGTLNEAIKKVCPKAPEITSQSKEKHIYHFLESFASDSGNIPSCN
ncbi:MAG: cytochrome C [Sulfurospirillum sp.]|nr:cytochrome C [Sulfurospirillum sp.]